VFIRVKTLFEFIRLGWTVQNQEGKTRDKLKLWLKYTTVTATENGQNYYLEKLCIEEVGFEKICDYYEYCSRHHGSPLQQVNSLQHALFIFANLSTASYC